MAKTALVAIADGTEDIESTAVIDILRRCSVDVTVVSVMKSKTIKTAHKIEITADHVIGDVKSKTFDAIILPGGLPGANHLRDCSTLADMVKKQKADGRLVCAICASPAVALETYGVLKGETATCYPGFEKEFKDCTASKDRVVISNNVVTSQGPCTAFEFGFAIAGLLAGEETKNKVMNDLYVVFDEKKSF